MTVFNPWARSCMVINHRAKNDYSGSKFMTHRGRQFSSAEKFELSKRASIIVNTRLTAIMYDVKQKRLKK